MQNYKVSNKPRMYICANNVICSIHLCYPKYARCASDVRHLSIHLLNNSILVFALEY